MGFGAPCSRGRRVNVRSGNGAAGGFAMTSSESEREEMNLSGSISLPSFSLQLLPLTLAPASTLHHKHLNTSLVKATDYILLRLTTTPINHLPILTPTHLSVITSPVRPPLLFLPSSTTLTDHAPTLYSHSVLGRSQESNGTSHNFRHDEDGSS